MIIPFVDLTSQYLSIKEEIDNAIKLVIENTAFIGGPFVKKFESEFAEYQKVKHCISCANGTDAIQIILKALEVRKDDEVIIPANSFIASSEAVTNAGAKVVFCDVDSSDNIDTNSIKSKITPKTKIILAVHLYGRPAAMDSILEIARKYKITVIEDSAQAHGAMYKGKLTGNFGHAASFSFYPGKNLGCYGDGGAMLTNDDDLAIKLRMLANHGRIDKYNHVFEGYNSRLDGIQAAILSAKLPYLNDWIKQRRWVAMEYSKGLNGVGDLILPEENDDVKSVFHLFVLKTKKRDALHKYLEEKGISCGVHYPIGLPFLKAYEHLGHSAKDFPVTFRNQNLILSLPIFPELNTNQVNYVINSVKSFFN